MKKSIICTSILALICLLAFSGLAAAMKIDGPVVMQGKTSRRFPSGQRRLKIKGSADDMVSADHISSLRFCKCYTPHNYKKHRCPSDILGGH